MERRFTKPLTDSNWRVDRGQVEGLRGVVGGVHICEKSGDEAIAALAPTEIDEMLPERHVPSKLRIVNHEEVEPLRANAERAAHSIEEVRGGELLICEKVGGGLVAEARLTEEAVSYWDLDSGVGVIDCDRALKFALATLTDYEGGAPIVLKRESMFGMAEQGAWLTEDELATPLGTGETRVVALDEGQVEERIECTVSKDPLLLAFCLAVIKEFLDIWILMSRVSPGWICSIH